MVNLKKKYAQLDPVWDRLRNEAEDAVIAEPAIGGFIQTSILQHPSFENALAHRVASKLASAEISEQTLRDICSKAISKDPQIANAARADVMAVVDRDPACNRYMQPLLYFKGFLAIQAYRVSNWLWINSQSNMAYFFQMRTSEVFGIDIHPAAKLGKGIMIDHGTGVVIGETSVIKDNVSIFQGVTLGGTGKETGDRHPKVMEGVLLSASSTVLGNVQIGRNAKIAAGSVVLEDVKEGTTVAGVPAKEVSQAVDNIPADDIDHLIE